MDSSAPATSAPGTSATSDTAASASTAATAAAATAAAAAAASAASAASRNASEHYGGACVAMHVRRTDKHTEDHRSLSRTFKDFGQVHCASRA